ncbi:MAG: hypothetical protein QGF09_01030 [Rhodospirillales bacterium]|nr:hypothetical protein [Rhodospirillales bacterium]
MTSSAAAQLAQSRWTKAGLDFRNLIWCFTVIGVMIWAIVDELDWLLRFIHIVTGVLLTGADILLGFLIGPILRSLDFKARREFSLKMLPKTLFIMNTLGLVAPTSGWFLAVRTGYLDLGYPEFYWVIAALVISAILAIQGLGLLLPANLKAYLEWRKEKPDPARVQRFMRIYFVVVGSQGLMQVAIVIVMVNFAYGL